MAAVIITEYFKECGSLGIDPTLKGLYEFKKLWRD